MFNSLSMIENIDSVIKGLAQKSDALVFACTRVPCHQCVFMHFVLLLNAKHELLMLQNGIALVVVVIPALFVQLCACACVYPCVWPSCCSCGADLNL